MSASIRPTRWPSLDRAIARLTATVVLPTPPLPEPMATILDTPGRATGDGILGAWAMLLLVLGTRSKGQDSWSPRSSAVAEETWAPIFLRSQADKDLLRFYSSWGSSFSCGASDRPTLVPTAWARMV